MNREIVPKVLKYKWHPWLRRNFHAFMMSLFEVDADKGVVKVIKRK